MVTDLYVGRVGQLVSPPPAQLEAVGMRQGSSEGFLPTWGPAVGPQASGSTCWSLVETP